MSSTPLNPTHFKGTARLSTGIVLGVLTFWLFAQSMTGTVPQVQQSVEITKQYLTLGVSLTALFSGLFVVVTGGLADKFGRVRLTQIGFMLSIIGSLLVAVSTESLFFLLGRAIQGLSGACIMPATLALMKTYYQGKARQKALSFWSIGSWGGSGACQLAGGTIATYANWRWIYIACIVVSIIGMLLIKGTPESKGESKAHRFDYGGLVFFIITLFSLNFFITQGKDKGWTSFLIFIVLAIFIVSFIIFFIVEKKKSTPVL